MSDEKKLLDVVTKTGSGTRLGRVTALLEDAVLVVCEPEPGVLACDVLEAPGGGPIVLAEDDVVLVVFPDAAAGRGVVVGRIGRPIRQGSTAKAPPEEIVLEATKGLTLKVGEGSITLREDGRVLIRGRDLVSHARRLNRIRGGSVAIN